MEVWDTNLKKQSSGDQLSRFPCRLILQLYIHETNLGLMESKNKINTPSSGFDDYPILLILKDLKKILLNLLCLCFI